jgi:hypothetical protein
LRAPVDFLDLRVVDALRLFGEGVEGRFDLHERDFLLCQGCGQGVVRLAPLFQIFFEHLHLPLLSGGIVTTLLM